MTIKSGPGKSYRTGITLMDAVKMFDTKQKAEAWFVSKRWPNGPVCPFCQSMNVATIASRKPQPFRCRDCRKHFSVKTGTLMHSAKIPLSKWAIAFYLYSTNLTAVVPGRVLDEAPPRLGHSPGISVVYGPPNPGDVGQGRGEVRWPSGSRRNLYRREGSQQA